ncbi:MAG TPA: hypothetical protein VFR23_25060 [Jiangellaceae bacterium]|nr:hypothetical protein [Jiangellaceae bacterium]
MAETTSNRNPARALAPIAKKDEDDDPRTRDMREALANPRDPEQEHADYVRQTLGDDAPEGA